MARGPARALIGLVLAAGLLTATAGAALLIVQYRVYQVAGFSMSPMLLPGDRIVVRAGAGSVERGDVVILTPQAWPAIASGEGSDQQNVDQQGVSGSDQVKQVFAVGGDTVACCDAEGLARLGQQPADALGQWTTAQVPSGRLFLIGADPGLSIDSRAHLKVDGGTVSVSAVRGQVKAVAYPVGRWRAVAPGGAGLLTAIAMATVIGIGAAGAAGLAGTVIDRWPGGPATQSL